MNDLDFPNKVQKSEIPVSLKRKRVNDLDFPNKVQRLVIPVNLKRKREDNDIEVRLHLF